jgi:hypothetical protein
MPGPLYSPGQDARTRDKLLNDPLYLDRLVRDQKKLQEQRAAKLGAAQKKIDSSKALLNTYNNGLQYWVKRANDIIDQYGDPPAGQTQKDLLAEARKQATAAKQNVVKQENILAEAIASKKTIERTIGQNDSPAAIALRKKKAETTKKRVEDAKKKQTSKDTGNNKPPADKPNIARGPYIYNAPLVKTALFRSTGPQIKVTDSGFSGPTAFQDALKGFTASQNSRGAIQMSMETAFHLNANSTTPGQTQKDKTPHGFRFHYNPTSIMQSYGTLANVSPTLMMSGKDDFNITTPLATQSGFQFELYLNRIEDMNYIPYITDSNVAPYGATPEDPGFKKKGAYSLSDVYGEQFDVADLKEIYERGTMYDIEYLFKAVHGAQGSYQSILRGKTWDIGWLNGMAVEFHLGSKLRYLGRITNLSLNHVMFNERMVPILTTVTISASRYYDLPKGKLGAKS